MRVSNALSSSEQFDRIGLGSAAILVPPPGSNWKFFMPRKAFNQRRCAVFTCFLAFSNIHRQSIDLCETQLCGFCIQRSIGPTGFLLLWLPPLTVIVVLYQLAQFHWTDFLCRAPRFFAAMNVHSAEATAKNAHSRFTDEVERYRFALIRQRPGLCARPFAISIILLSHAGDKYYCKTLTPSKERKSGLELFYVAMARLYLGAFPLAPCYGCFNIMLLGPFFVCKCPIFYAVTSYPPLIWRGATGYFCPTSPTAIVWPFIFGFGYVYVESTERRVSQKREAEWTKNSQNCFPTNGGPNKYPIHTQKNANDGNINWLCIGHSGMEI